MPKSELQDIPLEDSEKQQQKHQQPITSEPKPVNEMNLQQQPQDNELQHTKTNNSSTQSSSSDSDFISQVSGYERDTNECSEFCIEFCTCFGVVDCCPRTGEGCLTTTATFIGNLIFGCCKC
ncbi:unnamed protein product [Candida verbasci]|uniref:Uncharacterized protein n=1 Tax=Candida verbasci TaxID=1227364 RepID=A0A9W4TYC8_9ASCO|nr:unnamed protein product [Candida verbasci]